MTTAKQPSAFWVVWLSLVCCGVALFGISLVLMPAFARYGFSLLLFFDPNHVESFGTQINRYISLAHAVLGAVMFGWGAVLLLIVRSWFVRGVREAWLAITISVVAWFVPDTAYSLWVGFWQNAVLNFVFFLLFCIPLLATRKAFHETHV